MRAFYGPEQAAIHDERFGDLARDAARLVVSRLHAAGITDGPGHRPRLRLGDPGRRGGAGRVRRDRRRPLAGDGRPGPRRGPGATFTVGSVHDAAIAPSVAVTATGEVLQYATDPRAGLDALRVLAGAGVRALAPGGVFVFDVSTPGRNLGLDVRHVLPRPRHVDARRCTRRSATTASCVAS